LLKCFPPNQLALLCSLPDAAADPTANLAVHPVVFEVDGCARAILLTRCFNDCRLTKMPDVLGDRCGIERLLAAYPPVVSP
jgi:hypothetical protein